MVSKGSRYALTFQDNPPDDSPMSKKEGHIPTNEAKVRDKEQAKRGVTTRVKGGVRANLPDMGGFIEMMPRGVIEGTSIVEEVEESRLTDYVNRCLANIDLARQRMGNDQIEIDRLREETRSLIADLVIA
ncbi:MAG: hypothetical protein QOH25_1333 [Acidobacteriota bacterium]|nr:hypothetical protein [Acidobacteriota bacterium]